MITSASNKKVKNIRSLISSKKERDRQGLYVIEGVKLFSEADISKIKEVYVSESFNCGFLKKLQITGYEKVSDNVFSKMSDTVTPQGVLCVMASDKYDLDKLCEESDNRNEGKKLHIIILEGLQDPGNLGTIIRSAEAAGFDFIIADSATADVYSPKAIRSTMGAVFRMPLIYCDNLTDTVKALKNRDITVYAAHLKGEKSYRDICYNSRCAIVIGNEGNGLSEKMTDAADMLVKIPMHGKAESLNAAVAASLLMFEI